MCALTMSVCEHSPPPARKRSPYSEKPQRLQEGRGPGGRHGQRAELMEGSSSASARGAHVLQASGQRLICHLLAPSAHGASASGLAGGPPHSHSAPLTVGFKTLARSVS